jgi:uncharacterized protein YrrD
LIQINDFSKVKELKRTDDRFQLMSQLKHCKINTKVFSKEGEKIGHIKDINIDTEFAIIDSFVISDGVIEDLISGRKLLSYCEVIHNNKSMNT